jgi:outer membrane protein
MKRKSWLVLLLMATLASASAYAQEVRIGYVDMRTVLNESKAGKRVRAELEKSVKQREEQLGREEQQLKDLQAAFEKDKLLLTEAQRQTKQKEYDERVKAFQQTVAQARRELEGKEREFAEKAMVDIRAIVRDLAKEEKLAMVVERQALAVIYPTDGLDLTDKIIKRLDAKSGG